MLMSLSIDAVGLEALAESSPVWRYYERQMHLQDGARIVVVSGWDGDWVAYIGRINATSLDVERHGEKLRQEEAEQLFPWVGQSLKYRP